MARTFATNNVGLAATFHPFIAPMRAARQRRAGRHRQRRRHPRPAGHGAYCASKAGVISYCESLRGELRGSGVQVVTIAPGYVDTPLTQQNRYGMPFLMQRRGLRRRAFRASRRAQLPRDPVADGRGGQAAAPAARMRCSTGCWRARRASSAGAERPPSGAGVGALRPPAAPRQKAPAGAFSIGAAQ
jgi:NAD(P)-dependent dehydrogenase (short-subunit alcohol dehydrogenase family)